VRSINRNKLLLQQFLLAIRQISSEFIFQQDSVPVHTAFEDLRTGRLGNQLLSDNFAKCRATLKILPEQTQQ